MSEQITTETPQRTGGASGPAPCSASRIYHESVESALADGWHRAWYGDLRKDGSRRVYGIMRPYVQRVFRCYRRHAHIQLDSGAMASVDRDVSPETLHALNQMVVYAREAIEKGLIESE